LTAVRAVSTLEEELEREFELVFVVVRTASMLDEELLRVRLEVWLAVIELFTTVSAASTLDEELERLSEDV
jgi:hypothetical protein